MKNALIVLSICLLAFTACTKDKTPSPLVKAAFNIGGQAGGFIVTYTDTVFTIGTNDVLVLLNQSANADSIVWNFGNGKTSTSYNTPLSYESPGVYTISLTAFSKNGSKSVSTKNITVLERVIKDFSLSNFQLNQFSISQQGLPIFTKADIWMEIKFSDSWADIITNDNDILGKVQYISPVFANVDSSFHGTLSFTLPSKTIINYPVNNINYPEDGRGTMINIYAKDDTGTYLLASSAWVGLQVTGGGNPGFSKNYGLEFWVPGSLNTFKMNCVYQ